jgi:hypothetical protein
MWLSINKAITLLGIDFARNGFEFPLDEGDVLHSRALMEKHSQGYQQVPQSAMDSMYKEFLSYIAKYLKISGSLEAVEIMDKLVKTPVSKWINENGYNNHWDTGLIEKVFNSRNRSSDSILREEYLTSIKSMRVDFADNLNDFHSNLASYLNIELKQAKSLYQMFKRENYDIEFLGGRLVYLGD